LPVTMTMTVRKKCRTGSYNIERSRSNKWTDIFVMGLFSWTLTQSFFIYRHFHKEDLSKRSHAAFQLQVAQSFIFNQDNRAMHQQLSRKPTQSSRHTSSTSTTCMPTGYYHSIEHFPTGRGTDTTRKLRYACVVCPTDSSGSRNKCSTFCRECRLPVHDVCFAKLHNEPGYERRRREGHKETIAYLEDN
jgi:hypothetical protein